MSNTNQCIDVCNSLLRGEMSAVETYTQAIEKFDSDPYHAALIEIRSEHEHSASVLRQHLIEMGAEPSDSSGVWGSFAEAVEGTAKLLGESAALTALEQGEEHGINEYENALEDGEVMDEIKAEIRRTLLPRLTGHVSILRTLKNR